MLETFIILLCLGDYGCSEAQRAYLSTSQGKELSRKAKREFYKHIDKEHAATLGTFYAGLTNRKVKVRIKKGLTLEGDHDTINVVYKYEF